MDDMNLFDNKIVSVESSKKRLVHYEGELGIFDYDPEEFVIQNSIGMPYLQYCGKGISVNLPDGCTNTRYMFYGCDLKEGFSLGNNFDTSNVTSMKGMFRNCKLREGFSLGEKFDTSNVTDMRCMFDCCELPKGFTLGEKFDTSNVISMFNMFYYCSLPRNFSLGEKFDTSNVTDMSGMFCKCNLHEDFSLGERFDTSSVTDMRDMFNECILPKGFSLGEHFDISRVEHMENMFRECKYNGIDICTYFRVQNDEELILKLRKSKGTKDSVTINSNLEALMQSVSEELQVPASVVQRMVESYLKSLLSN